MSLAWRWRQAQRSPLNPDPLNPPTLEIGLFGGSFNPPHVAHLAVAEACAEAAGLDRVVWMPAATPPHKQGHAALASAGDRLAMVRAAVAGNPRFEVSDLEVRRAGVSFTVDTLRQLRDGQPGAEWSLIVGGDSLAGFSSWREPEAILEMARLVVYARPGTDFTDVPAALMQRVVVVEGPLLELSSTVLRARLAAGRSVRYLVPDPVLAVVRQRGLYAARGIAEAPGG